MVISVKAAAVTHLFIDLYHRVVLNTTDVRCVFDILIFIKQPLHLGHFRDEDTVYAELFQTFDHFRFTVDFKLRYREVDRVVDLCGSDRGHARIVAMKCVI